jgi:hypothetical protein
MHFQSCSIESDIKLCINDNLMIEEYIQVQRLIYLIYHLDQSPLSRNDLESTVNINVNQELFSNLFANAFGIAMIEPFPRTDKVTLESYFNITSNGCPCRSAAVQPRGGHSATQGGGSYFRPAGKNCRLQ